MPSQTGRWKRICVQAKIQGMALRSSMLPAALRLAGRLPMFMRPSSLTGVHAWKNSMKLGLPRTTSLYAAHDTCAHDSSQAQGTVPDVYGSFDMLPCERSLVHGQSREHAQEDSCMGMLQCEGQDSRDGCRPSQACLAPRLSE